MSRNYTNLFDAHEAMMLQDADSAITECNLWDWLRGYTPEEGKGFMFSQHPNLNKIDAAMKFRGHSSSSHAWTMRQMEYIAKNGWDALQAEVLRNTDIRKLARDKYRASEHYKQYSEYLKICSDEERGGILRAIINEEERTFKNLRAIKTDPPIVEAVANMATVLRNVKNNDPSPLDIAEASRGVPGFEGQADAMKRFSEGKMTYAEMRSLCG